MIKGIGVDIVEIDRIKSAIQKYGKTFLDRIFTKKEISYCRRGKRSGFAEFSARFAAKEAFSKALGVGMLGMGGKGKKGINLKEVEILKNKLGKPFLVYKNKVQKKAHVSLSHSRDFAVATVYVEK